MMMHGLANIKPTRKLYTSNKPFIYKQWLQLIFTILKMYFKNLL